jgi:hypothetical protein
MTGKPLIRIIPSRLAILASPKIKAEDVLWYEDMAELLRRNDTIGVVECNCRRIHQKCDKPLLTCLSALVRKGLRDVGESGSYCFGTEYQACNGQNDKQQLFLAGFLFHLANPCFGSEFLHRSWFCPNRDSPVVSCN